MRNTAHRDCRTTQGLQMCLEAQLTGDELRLQGVRGELGLEPPTLGSWQPHPGPQVIESHLLPGPSLSLLGSVDCPAVGTPRGVCVWREGGRSYS